MAEEVKRPARIEEKAYWGVPIKSIPGGLRERVEATVETAKKDGQFSINFVDVIGQEGREPLWKYGDYTDVYVFDGSALHESFHKYGSNQYSMFISGGGRPEYLDNIAKALGFDKNKADVIPGLGHTKDTSPPERQTTPTGPYYGMKY